MRRCVGLVWKPPGAATGRLRSEKIALIGTDPVEPNQETGGSAAQEVEK